MSLSDPAQVRAVTGNYISTYVLGGEQEIRTGVAPIPLEWHKGPELQAFLAANAHSALSINQLWTAFQLAYPAVVIAEREFKYPMSVEKKRVDTASYRASQAALHGVVGQKTHLLTDYPEHVKITRNEIGPEGDRIAAAIQNLLLTHDWVAHPMQGNKVQAGWTALLATVQSGHTFVHHHIRHNATAAEIITDLGV
ncbi:MAG: hypothetical protein IPP72_16940 [Chitinophagaceae bacterium]|nr:hypothetical protein [Chitinophagaceae bacterium]